MNKSKQKQDTPPDDEVRGKPVSLAPLAFEEALADLLQVKPEPKSGPVKKVGQKNRVKKAARK